MAEFIKFSEFMKELKESENAYSEICEIIDEMTEDEIQDFGDWLQYEFFEEVDLEDGSDVPYFTVEDIKDMILQLPEELYIEVLRMLDEDEADEVESEVTEGVSRIMKASNINRKKKKFMTKSKSVLRREQSTRKRENRANRAAKSRYYRANKNKIKSYQQSRNTNIEKGKHNVKLRRNA